MNSPTVPQGVLGIECWMCMPPRPSGIVVRVPDGIGWKSAAILTREDLADCLKRWDALESAGRK